MQSNLPKIPLLLSSIFFLFSLAAFIFLYMEINESEEVWRSKEIEWQRDTQSKSEIRALGRSIKMAEGEKALLETHFAQNSDIAPFLDSIERLAAQVNAKAEVSSVDLAEDNTGLVVGLKSSGSFESTYKFLTLLENSPYELEVVFMDIQTNRSPSQESASKGANAPDWEALFRIKLLSFIP